jgi:putative ABC transport system permease protein
VTVLRLAVRNLRRNRRRTAITLVALVVGVAGMVAIRGFILGMRAMILENQMNGTLGAVQVHHKGYVENVLSAPLTLDLADTPELRAKILAVPRVTALAPRIEFGAQLSTPDLKPPPEDGSALPEADQGKVSFLVMTGIDPALEFQVTPRKLEWLAAGRGALPKGALDEVVVLNDDFARGLEVSPMAPGTPLPPVEQRLALLAPDRDGSLNGENVMLSGTLASATPNDRRVGLVPLAVAQRLLRMEGRVTEYAVAVKKGSNLNEVRDALQAALGPEYEVHTWEQRMPFVLDMVKTQDFVFSVVSVVFLFIVLLGIVNAMLMSVLERVREIGTMLAVGMRRRQVVQLFLLEGLVLGALGGALGLLLGVVIVSIANRIGLPIPAPGAKIASIVRPEVTPYFLALVFVQATVGATLAAVWPAMRASNLKPVEALAHT